MLKRISSIVLTVVMLVSMLGTLVVASADPALPQLVLTSDDADGKLERGQTLTVTVALANYKAGSSIYIELPFDSALFAGVAIKSTNSLTVPGFGTVEVPFVNDALFTGNLDNGIIKALWASTAATGNFSADITTFCTLTFTVKNDAPIATYALNAAIKEYYYYSNGANPQYVAGTDYIEAAEALALEVACDHDYTNVAWAKPAEGTAEADAKHTRACTKCGTPEAVACTFDTVTVPEDCDNNGSVTKTCTVCQYAIVDAIDLIDGHAWSAYTNAEVGGVMTHKRVCGNDATHIEEAACTFVKNDAESIAPDCVNPGKDVFYCDVCNFKKEDDLAAGHALVKDADAETHSCTKCTLIVNAPCEYDNLVQAPTCVLDEIKECDCGRQKVTPAVGEHPEDKIVMIYTAPTADKDGSMVYHCDACAEDLWLLAEVPAGEPFTDIAAEDGLWYYDASVFAYGMGVMNGTYGEFLGDEEVTRGMIATVLGRIIFGGDELINALNDQEFAEMLADLSAYYEHEANELKDLNGSYYDRYALALAAMGIILGDDEGNFNGDDIATREEMATMIVRFLNLEDVSLEREIAPAATFTDMDEVSLWAVEAVEEAGQIGLFQGIYGEFKPQNTATRAELATLLERLIRAMSVYPVVDAA